MVQHFLILYDLKQLLNFVTTFHKCLGIVTQDQVSSIDLESTEIDECRAEFRFEKDDLLVLAELLKIRCSGVAKRVLVMGWRASVRF